MKLIKVNDTTDKYFLINKGFPIYVSPEDYKDAVPLFGAEIGKFKKIIDEEEKEREE